MWRGQSVSASTDFEHIFVHGWDLAVATDQNTDLDPELATLLLEQAKFLILNGYRGPNGVAPFGPALAAKAGATRADRLVAYLGRHH